MNVYSLLLRVNGFRIIDEHFPVDDILDPDGPVLVGFESEHAQGVGIPAPEERNVELPVRDDVA